MTKKSSVGFVKSAVQACARWAGIPIDAGNGVAYNIPAGEWNAYGQCVLPTTALKLSAVWACVSLLSDTIGTLPLRLYERTPSGRRTADDHPVFRVLSRQPNTKMTAAKFIGATVATMLLRGVSYWEKQLSAGRVIGLNFLAYDCLNVIKRPDGSREYWYSENGRRRHIPTANVVRVIGFSLNGEDGLSAVQYGAHVFGSAMAAEQSAASTFRRGLLPTVYFKYPKVLKPDQRADARNTIEQLSGAVNAGKPVILEADMDAGNIGINPNDAQLLESRQLSAAEICSWFRVQPWMVGRAQQGQTMWGSGIEQQMIGFITFTLAPLLRCIEQTIEKDVLSPAEKGRFYAEFSLEGLLRGDSTSRREFYASALQNGWMNRNQVRALENYDPYEGGEVFTVQSNLIPVDQLGNSDSSSGAASALKRWLGITDKETEHEN